MARGFKIVLLILITFLIGASAIPIHAQRGYHFIRWSADGRWLLVDLQCAAEPSEQDGIYLLEISGDQILSRTQITNSNFRLRDVPAAPTFEERAIIATNEDIYEIVIEDFGLNNLTVDIPPITNLLAPPNAERLLLESIDNNAYVLDIAEGEPHLITVDPDMLPLSRWRWSPNGDALFAHRDNELYAFSPSGDEPYLLTADIPPANFGQWLPDSETIIIRTEDGELYLLSASGDEWRLLTADIPPVYSVNRLTPPYRETFFVETGDATDRDALYVLDIDEGELRLLTAGISDLRSWGLPNDGKILAATDDFTYYVLDVAGGDPILLIADFSRIEGFVWSPNREMIFIRAADDNYYLLDAGGGDPRLLATNIGTLRGLEWSLDSEAIFYAVDGDGVYVLDIDGGDPRLITTNISPAWHFERLSSGEIFFATEDGDLYILDAIESEPHLLTADIPAIDVWRWLPDSQKLIVWPSSESTPIEPGWYSSNPFAIYLLPQGTHPHPWHATISPDNRLVAIEQCSAEYGVHLVNLDDAPNG